MTHGFSLQRVTAVDRCLMSNVRSLQIIDDGANGFSSTGAWIPFPGQGFQNDVTYSSPGTGADVATWSFNGLVPGMYRVSATWSAHPNRATNAPYTVLNGSAVLATVPINQELVPNDYTADGAAWEDLGGPYVITGNRITVRLSDNANEFVIADGVRVEKVGNLPNVRIIDDGAAGFTGTASFFSFPGQGYQNDVTYANPGAGDEIASWTFTGFGERAVPCVSDLVAASQSGDERAVHDPQRRHVAGRHHARQSGAGPERLRRRRRRLGGHWQRADHNRHAPCPAIE